MKTFAIFVLLITPKPECIEKIKKENLTNCREEAHMSGSIYENYVQISNQQVCDLRPEKELKPLPKAEVKFFPEQPQLPQDTDCYTYRIGKLEVNEVLPIAVFGIGSGMIEINTASKVGL